VQIAPLIAVVHDFANTRGSFYDGEATYSVAVNGMVTMTVRGSNVCYIHSVMHWMRLTNHYSSGNYAMSWSLVTTIGSFLIYKFIASEVRVRTDAAPLHQQLTDPNLYAGEVNVAPLLTAVTISKDVDQYEFVTNVFSYGPNLLISCEGMSVHVPKELIQVAASAAVNQIRSADLLNVLVIRVRSHYNQMFHGPSSVPSVDFSGQVIHLAAVLGMVLGVQKEKHVLKTLIQPNLLRFANLASLLKFDFHVKNYWKLALVGAFLAFGASFTTSLATLDYYLLPLIFGCVAVLSLLLFIYSFINYKSVEKELCVPDLLRIYANTYLFPHRTINFSSPVRLPAISNPKPLEAPRIGSKLVPSSLSPNKSRLGGPTLVGLGVATCVPLVPADTRELELAALVNRSLCSVPIPSPGRFEEVQNIVRLSNIFYFPNMPRKIKAFTFDSWNQNFPVARQNAHRKAYSIFQLGPSAEQVRKDCVRKTFLKREKLIKHKFDDIDPFNPRLIQGVGDLANSLLGPWIYAFSHALRKSWNLDHSLTYAAGMNAEDLGEWATRTEVNALHHKYIIDMKHCDQSIGVEALVLEQSIYEMFGCPHWAKLVLQAQLHPRGFTSHGHYYSIPGTRCSGDPNTSVGNTIIVGLVSWMVFSRLVLELYDVQLKFDVHVFMAIIMGDDITVALKFFIPSQRIEDLYREFGFEVKLRNEVDINLVTFCSGRFWDVSTVDKQKRVFGPLLGRVLSKLAYSVPPLDKPYEWLKGVLIGVKRDYNHIPILQHYVDHQLSLLDPLVPGRVRKIQVDHRVHTSMWHDATEATYRQLQSLYGITRKDVDEFVSYMKKQKLHTLMDQSLLHILVQVDC
jgi:hypothetical protein